MLVLHLVVSVLTGNVNLNKMNKHVVQLVLLSVRLSFNNSQVLLVVLVVYLVNKTKLYVVEPVLLLVLPPLVLLPQQLLLSKVKKTNFV